MQPVASDQLAMAKQVRTAHQVSQCFTQAFYKYSGKSNESPADISKPTEPFLPTISALVRRKLPSSIASSTKKPYNTKTTTYGTIQPPSTKSDRTGYIPQLRAFRLQTTAEVKNMNSTEALG
jgi:hypothetical protein